MTVWGQFLPFIKEFPRESPSGFIVIMMSSLNFIIIITIIFVIDGNYLISESCRVYAQSYCTNLLLENNDSTSKKSQTLFHYINAFLSEQNSHVKRLPFGPSTSLVLISRVTERIYSYAAYTVFIQTIYAIQNGYYISYDNSPYANDYLMFPKVSPLLAAMANSTTIFDFYVWVDAGKVRLISLMIKRCVS